MSTSAPRARQVDALSGDITRLSEASDWIARQDGAMTLEAENARLQRDVEMLTRQLDALLSTDKAEMQCRIQELEAEIRDLKRMQGRRGW